MERFKVVSVDSESSKVELFDSGISIGIFNTPKRANEEIHRLALIKKEAKSDNTKNLEVIPNQKQRGRPRKQ